MLRHAIRFVPIALALLFLISPTFPFAQKVASNSYPDNSDWWSGLSPDQPESSVSIQIQERQIASTNFRILGISLSQKMFDQAAVKLGKTQILQRGDASTGRSQACYVSAQASPKAFLIFEQGEVDFTVYVFSDPRPWNGMDRCTPSSLVSAALSTASGLHLGQSQSELIAILGKPSRRTRDSLVYSLHAQKKTSAEDLKLARKNSPDMSDAEFHSNFDSYDLGVAIVAKFTASKLTYIDISKAETY